MTSPTPISQHKPSNDENGQPLTQKNDIENVALVITSAKPVKNFWIVEATRTDTGEAIAFSGSKVINDVMAHVTAKKAFPVSAILVKVAAENPQGYYWDIQDPPGTLPAPSGRTQEVGAFIDRGRVSVEDVQTACKEIAGEPTKVADLLDEQYAALIQTLRALESSALAVDEEPF